MPATATAHTAANPQLRRCAGSPADALTSLLCSVEEGEASCSRALLLHMLRLAPERQRLRAARVSIAA